MNNLQIGYFIIYIENTELDTSIGVGKDNLIIFKKEFRNNKPHTTYPLTEQRIDEFAKLRERFLNFQNNLSDGFLHYFVSNVKFTVHHLIMYI